LRFGGEFAERHMRASSWNQRDLCEAIQPRSFGVVARTWSLTAFDLKAGKEMEVAALKYEIPLPNDSDKPHPAVTNCGGESLCDARRKCIKMSAPARVGLHTVTKRGRKDDGLHAVHGPDQREVNYDALLRNSSVERIGYDNEPSVRNWLRGRVGEKIFQFPA